MDYKKWAMEYLKEAEQLRQKVTVLRQKAKKEKGKQEKAYLERIALLNAMYLECKHTGEFLKECGVYRCVKDGI